MLCGIDEAGRGPVIGPMVICGLICDEENLLKTLKVRDSKLTTDEERQKIAPQLMKKCKYYAITVSPQEIDEAVEGKTVKNLNWLEAEKAAQIINKLKPIKAIIDCPSPNCKAWKSYVLERLENKKTEITAEHKADANYLVVGAASIVAKLLRDKEIEKIKKELNYDFGNGYMTDPKTTAFLEKNWNKHPEIFRHSWAPFKKEIQKLTQQNLDTFK